GFGRGEAGSATGTGRTTGPAGMAGAHAPGGMGGAGGRGEKRGGNRFVRPTRFGCEGLEDEDEMLLGDRGITGQAVRHEEGDRHWERMRRRWLDSARTDGPAPHAQPAAGGETPAEQNTLLNQLTTALLGPEAGTDGATALAGIGSDSSADGTTGTGNANGGGEGGTAPAGGDRSAHGTRGESASGTGTSASPDEDYLDRARSAAARRGRPDDDNPAASTTGTGSGTDGAGKPAERAPLREEGGYQVPSPFLRAALARLATSGGADGAAPGGAAAS
ncbi:hypothetical protein KSNIM_05130, partial [Kitasatospora sp. DSM 101779]|nr:hypothetical protein [Kitasatospora sp. DSM 101779]